MSARSPRKRRPDPETLRRFLLGARSETPPDALSADKIPLREVSPPAVTAKSAHEAGNGYVRAYVQGECSVLVTREFQRWHLSVMHPKRYPTWLEISAAWYRAIPNAANLCGALLLPPLDSYVNLKEFCMQVVEIDREKHE